jgi:hypothetical protein
MDTKDHKLSIGMYMIETILGVALFYFVFGGSSAHSAVWAGFVVFAVWIVLMNAGHDVGLVTSESYDRWKLLVGFLIVIAVLGAGLWGLSWWVVALGLLLAIIWRGDLRAYQAFYRKNHRSQKPE